MTPSPWLEQAKRRAKQHRWTQRNLQFTQADGSPLANCEITSHNQAPSFRVGTCAGKSLLGSNAIGERQRNAVRSNFPLIVAENAMKWYATEVENGVLTYEEADNLAAWCKDENIPLRGHCLFWDKAKFNQDWVKALSDSDLKARMSQRLQSILPRYQGQIRDWDALNELLDGGFVSERLGPDGPAWVFREAASIARECRFFTNEYGILDSDERTEKYYELISRLRDSGAPVGGIGIQEHAAERFVSDSAEAMLEADRPERQGRGPLIPDEIWKRLDRLSSLGLPIHFTEISITTQSRERAARCMDMLLRTAYAHPAVECCLFWGFEARNHWLGDIAALIDQHGRPYPALLALSECQREWQSQGTLTTDENGTCSIEGWKGDYVFMRNGEEIGQAELTAGSSDIVAVKTLQ